MRYMIICLILILVGCTTVDDSSFDDNLLQDCKIGCIAGMHYKNGEFYQIPTEYNNETAKKMFACNEFCNLYKEDS